MGAKKEWLLSMAIVISLTIGSSLMFHLDKLLLNILERITSSPAINAKENSIITALEMGIVPIFAVLAFALLNKWNAKQIINISWKVFLVGAFLGALIGSTYSLNYQSLSNGIIH